MLMYTDFIIGSFGTSLGAASEVKTVYICKCSKTKLINATIYFKTKKYANRFVVLEEFDEAN